MSPVLRLVGAGLAPIAIALIAMALRPAAVGVLALTGGVAAAIAVLTGLFTAVQGVTLPALLKRLLVAMMLRLLLTGTAVLVLTRSAPDHALTIALVLAGGVAAAVLSEAFLLIPSREPVRA